MPTWKDRATCAFGRPPRPLTSTRQQPWHFGKTLSETSDGDGCCATNPPAAEPGPVVCRPRGPQANRPENVRPTARDIQTPRYETANHG